MTQYDNSGILFPNDIKTSPKAPDYKGDITIEGVKHWLSGWMKEGKGGSKFLTLAIGDVKEERPPKDEDSF